MPIRAPNKFIAVKPLKNCARSRCASCSQKGRNNHQSCNGERLPILHSFSHLRSPTIVSVIFVTLRTGGRIDSSVQFWTKIISYLMRRVLFDTTGKLIASNFRCLEDDSQVDEECDRTGFKTATVTGIEAKSSGLGRVGSGGNGILKPALNFAGRFSRSSVAHHSRHKTPLQLDPAQDCQQLRPCCRVRKVPVHTQLGECSHSRRSIAYLASFPHSNE